MRGEKRTEALASFRNQKGGNARCRCATPSILLYEFVLAPHGLRWFRARIKTGEPAKSGNLCARFRAVCAIRFVSDARRMPTTHDCGVVLLPGRRLSHQTSRQAMTRHGLSTKEGT